VSAIRHTWLTQAQLADLSSPRLGTSPGTSGPSTRRASSASFQLV